MAEYDFSMFEKPKEKELDFSMFEGKDKSAQKVAELDPTIVPDDRLSMPQKGQFMGFLGGSINQATKGERDSVALQKLVEETPDLQLTVLGLNPEKAEILFSHYEAKGVDPKYEVVPVISSKGIQKQIRPKIYMSGTDKITLDDDKEYRDFVSANLSKNYKTNILDEFAEGFGANFPSEKEPGEAIKKLQELHPQYAQDVGLADVPWEHLSPAQKTAYSVGFGVGFVSTGSAISKVAKGVMTGAKALGPYAVKAASWLEGAGAKAGEKVTEKLVPIGGEMIGEFAGNVTKSLVQNSPALSTEGIIFEGLRTDGDVKSMVQGAGIFLVTGAVGGEALGSAGKYLKNKDNKKIAKMILENKNNPFKAQKDIVLNDPDYIINKTMEKALVEADTGSRFVATQIKITNKLKAVDKQVKQLDDEMNRLRGKKEISRDELKKVLGRDDRLAQLQNKKENLVKKKESMAKDPLYDPNLNIDSIKGISTESLMAKMYIDRLRNYGIPLNNKMGVYYNIFSKVLNQTEKFSLIQEKTNMPVGHLPMQAIEASYNKNKLLRHSESFNISKNLEKMRKLEVGGEQAWEWFHYIRKKQDGSYGWDPSELKVGKYTVPKFEGEAPRQEIQDILFDFRKMTDWNHSILKAHGVDGVGYTPGYMAIMPKVEFGNQRIYMPKQTKSGRAGFLKERTQGIIPKEERHLYHTDFYDMIPVMNQKAINAATFHRFDKSIDQAYFMANAMGKKDLGEYFLKYRETVKGIKPGDHNARKIQAADVIAGHADAIEGLANIILKRDQSIVQETLSTLNNLMYHAYIGLSLPTLTKQFIQPYVVGAAEVGQLNIMHGMIGAYGKGNIVSLARKMKMKPEKVKQIYNEAQVALDRVRDRLIPPSINYELLSEPQRKQFKMAANLMNLPAWPGMKMFSYLDGMNRKTSFLGGRKAFMDAQKKGARQVSDLLDQMLISEKTQVLKAYEKYGLDVAADEAGLIFAKRHNYAYSLAERGELFSSGLGKHIPFVHWGANTWMRHMENIRNGNGLTLAKRVGYAAAGVMAMQNI